MFGSKKRGVTIGSKGIKPSVRCAGCGSSLGGIAAFVYMLVWLLSPSGPKEVGFLNFNHSLLIFGGTVVFSLIGGLFGYAIGKLAEGIGLPSWAMALISFMLVPLLLFVAIFGLVLHLGFWGTNGLYSVRFADTNTGWAVGVAGKIIKTTDGGTTWVSQSSGVGEQLLSLCLTDSNTVWAVGRYGTILKTNDGGATWIPKTSGTTNELDAVYFADANTGWAVGEHGSILKTTDSGATWTPQTSGTTNDLRSVYFADANTGWAVGKDGTILKTADGGATWTTQVSGNTEWLDSVYFIDTNTGWAVGGSRTILKTTDSGATWTDQASGTTYSFDSVYFTEANTGWAVGGDGRINKTTDGGATWTPQTSGTTNDLVSVYFIDANTGWAAGRYGTILKTTDSGATWTNQTPITSGTTTWSALLEMASGFSTWMQSPSTAGTTTRSIGQAGQANAVQWGGALIIIGILYTLVMAGSMWRIFTKAGQPGWLVLIPFYNLYIMLKIAGKPGYWVLLMLVPFFNIVFVILTYTGISNKFGKGGGFAIGLIFFPFIFFPILAFGSAVYEEFGRALLHNGENEWTADEDQYINDCLKQNYEELPETRSYSDPIFRKVLAPLNSGDNVGACSEAESLIERFRDFANLYDWWSSALLRMGALDKAQKVLKDGLENTKEKHLLCIRLGEVEWKARDLKLAVYWWAQGLHCQESLSESNYGSSTGAYLYLYYVAEGLRLSECSKAFLMRVDTVRSDMIRLNTETANDLISLARSGKNRSIERVLKELVQRYIIPKKMFTIKVDTSELYRLIQQLEHEMPDREKKYWGDEAHIKVIERLAEIGDPQAIDVLTRVSQKVLLYTVVDAAKRAIDKIKMANR